MTTDNQVDAIVKDMGFGWNPGGSGTDLIPYCPTCHRAVHEYSVEMPEHELDTLHGSTSIPTGEIIVTIKCHGKTFKRSNFRGEL